MYLGIMPKFILPEKWNNNVILLQIVKEAFYKYNGKYAKWKTLLI